MTTDLLTQDIVAKTFGISTRTMARMRAEGRGPAFIRLPERGRGVRYRAVDVAAWTLSRLQRTI
jgi:hypothetical protein